jgi:succinate dehydrogenase / fumarate reductase cytochrome b subunit
MNRFFDSSIGKKLLMALAGLFLCAFLAVHLSINLFLLKSDGGEAFKMGVEFMTTNIVIKVIEIGLFLCFALHILWGIYLQIQNWVARPVRYAKVNHSQTSFFSKYMIHTGVIIGVFLVIHLANFYFVKTGWVKIPQGALDKHDFYNMAFTLFKNPFYSYFYIISILILGFHLHHAFQSAFQTLGWNHPIYSPIIKYTGLVYSIAITLGFITIPIVILYFL